MRSYPCGCQSRPTMESHLPDRNTASTCSQGTGPAQLVAAGLVVIVIGRMNQPELLRLLHDADDIPGRAGNMGLAVAAHMGIGFILLADDDLDLAVAVHHDGAAAQG